MNLWANADAAREFERKAFGAYADGHHREAVEAVKRRERQEGHTPVSIERRGRFRIEPTAPEAYDYGYTVRAWHVYDDTDQDPYVGTFPTRREARAYVKQALLAESVSAAER